MSNQKEYPIEAAKFNIEVKVQKTDNNSDLLEENSTDLENYVSALAANNLRNPKNVCLLCWCQLTYAQKQHHLGIHSNYIKTAGHYTEKTSFVGFAIQYGHFKEINKVKFYYRLKEKPTMCMQLKKMKNPKEEVAEQKGEQEDSISVDLKKCSLKKPIKFNEDQDLINQASKANVNQQKKVIVKAREFLILLVKKV